MNECQDDLDENIEDEPVTLILPSKVFEDYQKVYEKDHLDIAKCFSNPKKEESRRAFLKSVSYVHHKAIFDCLNEFLDYERAYGIWGKPFPWKCQFSHQIFDFEIRKV